MRGGCLIGPGAVVGHATEVKNSAFLNGSQAGHFAYVGDSILGADANLGAGRQAGESRVQDGGGKKRGPPENIVLRVDGERIDTGLAKFGAVVG